jgi:hypothetical protein
VGDKNTFGPFFDNTEHVATCMIRRDTSFVDEDEMRVAVEGCSARTDRRGERWVSNEKKSFVQYTNAGLQKILSPQCQAYVTRIR